MIARALLGLVGSLAVSAASAAGGTAMDAAYDPGASNTEIRIGQTMPYSGPQSVLALQGTVMTAYFNDLNSRGGINGRMVNLISLDDGYSPPKTVEQTRKLVEGEEVLFIAGSLGTPTNAAIQAYLNAKRIPHLLIGSGSSKWHNPDKFRWSMTFYPSYRREAQAYASYIKATNPGANIAVLYQNDDSGRDFLADLKKSLGDDFKGRIVSQIGFEVADPTVDSPLLNMKAAGSDVLVFAGPPKFAVQAIRRAHEIGWEPLRLFWSPATSIAGVFQPAGLALAKGIVSALAFKAPLDPVWAETPDVKDYLAFMRRVGLDGRADDASAAYGYASAAMLRRILEAAGNRLTREHILEIATSLDAVDFPMVLPGIALRSTPQDYDTFKSLKIQRFNGKSWEVPAP
ncbi:ABC transporter substrate-binding protein [Chelatococcus reniformis]|nr:ABC transporter substrate-binding protein [Chelatococcus reniformis]